jgi:RNA polymerase sigma-70 factor (ECF subfamily)
VDEPEITQLLSGLSREHGRLFFRMAYGVLRNQEEAEDACQFAFMKLCEQWPTLRNSASAKAWVCRVVVNESFRVLRRRHVEQRALQDRDHPHQDAPPPSQLVEQRDLVSNVLAKLEEPTRTVVVMRQMQGMSGNEVKDLLGCSASEVSRRLHQGLEQLRGYLKETHSTPGGNS